MKEKKGINFRKYTFLWLVWFTVHQSPHHTTLELGISQIIRNDRYLGLPVHIGKIKEIGF
jgi:hypothetical protein